MSRTINIEHNGKQYGGQIGTIVSTTLGFESHGIMTASLGIDWFGGGVSVGGFCLDQPKNRDGGDYWREGTAYGLDHIIRILETVGVETWEKLKGQQIIVLFEGKSLWGSQPVGIASTTDESKIFILKDHAKEWIEAEA